MPLSIDLHCHSTASDGTLSPSQVVMRAAELGVQVLALTDHDTTEGLTDACQAAATQGIQLIPGIEISVTWDHQVVHIVGLDIDATTPELQQGLVGLREFRDWRAEEIGRRLEKAGIPGAFEGARALSNGRLVSRTHFARFLVNEGYQPDTKRVFKRYLTRGNPGHVPGQWATLEETMSWIKAAKGEAVIAHPARYPFTRSKLRRLIGQFQELGGVALEVVSGSHSPADCQTMGRHAREFQLMGSVGSDFHGPENPWTELGRLETLPHGVQPIWDHWELIDSQPDRLMTA